MSKGRQRCVEFACTWGHKSRKFSANGDQKEDKQEPLLDTDKLLIAALSCLDDCFLVVKPGSKYMYVPILK